MHDNDYDWEEDDLKQEVARLSNYSVDLLKHPNCSDPDHPGCFECVDED